MVTLQIDPAVTPTPVWYEISGSASTASVAVVLPEVSVTAGPAITEGETAMYTVRLTDAAVTGLTVPLTVDTGTYQAVDALPTSVTFAVGETEQTLAIELVDDDTDEADGEIVLTLTATPGTYRIAGEASARVAVTDNDLPQVSVTAGPAITEGGTAMYTVRLTDAAVESLTVPLTVDVGTYQAVDALPTRVVFAVGETEQTLAIELVDDDTDEADGEILLTLTDTPGTYRITGAVSARVAVTDNDLPQVSVTAGPAITEGETAMYTVRLTDAAVESLTVPLTVDTGTYQAVDALLTRVVFAVGETEQTLAIELVDDDTDEADGEIVLTLTATPGTYRIAGEASARVAVTDNDLPQVSVTAGPAITEGGTAMYTVRLTDAAVETLTVPLTVDVGTYQAVDALPTSAVFAVGETEQILAIELVDDDTDEADGEVVLTLTDTPGTYRIAGAASARVAVTDNDLPQVSVTAGPAITEGGTAMYTVRLTDAAVEALTVPLTVDIGTYQAVDALPTSVTFAAGETEQTLAIELVDDDMDEADGEIVLTLTAMGTYRITGAASVRVTVTDNDLPEVSVTAGPAITEGGTAMFTVRLADAAVTELTVPLTVNVGTYQAVDALPTSVVFAIGETEQTLAIELVDDDTDEADGEIVLTLTDTPGTYRIAGEASARVTVTDNDLPEVSVTAGPAITEGGTAMFTVRLADAAVTGLTVPLTVNVGTYQAVDALPTSVVFATGETEQTLAIELVDDDTDEADGDIALTLTDTPGTYRIAGAASARIAVTDNDLPEVSVTAGPAITEGGTAMFTVRLADAAVTGLTVPLTVDIGTYQAVNALPTSVVFATGEAEQTLAIAIEDDDTDEADGEIVLTLTAMGTYRITGAASARVTVTDNDLPEVSVTAGPAITEGGTAMYTVRLTDAAVTELTVPLTVDIGTYQAVDALPTRVVFATGETEQILAIAIENDDTDEADGEIVLTLTDTPGTYRIAGEASARVAVTDNDLPEVSVTAGPAITEGGTAMYTVRLADAAVEALTVPLTVDIGTYQAVDALPTSVTFAVGETEQILAIELVDDDTDEADGEIVLTLTDTPGTYRIAGEASARVAVTDNDLPEVSVTAGPAITEGGTAMYTVRLTDAAVETLTVPLTVDIGTYQAVAPCRPVWCLQSVKPNRPWL